MTACQRAISDPFRARIGPCRRPNGLKRPSGEYLTDVLVVRGELAGCVGFDRVGCALSAHTKERDIVDLRRKELDFGHDLTMLYGDYVEHVRQLSRSMGTDVVES